MVHVCDCVTCARCMATDRSHSLVRGARAPLRLAQMAVLSAQLANFQFRDRSWKAVQETARIMFGLAAVRMARASACTHACMLGTMQQMHAHTSQTACMFPLHGTIYAPRASERAICWAFKERTFNVVGVCCHKENRLARPRRHVYWLGSTTTWRTVGHVVALMVLVGDQRVEGVPSVGVRCASYACQ